MLSNLGILISVSLLVSIVSSKKTSDSEIFLDSEDQWKSVELEGLGPKFRIVRSLTDVNYELQPAEGRHKNRHNSYNYKSKPRRNQYNNHNRKSHNHNGKGGYHTSESFNSNSGYNTDSNCNRARKGDYGDSDHKQFGGKRGNQYGGHAEGGKQYGGRSGGSSGYHGGSGGHYQQGRSHHGHGGGQYGDDAGSYLDGHYE